MHFDYRIQMFCYRTGVWLLNNGQVAANSRKNKCTRCSLLTKKIKKDPIARDGSHVQKLINNEAQPREHKQSENVALSCLIQTLNGLQLLLLYSVFKVRS